MFIIIVSFYLTLLPAAQWFWKWKNNLIDIVLNKQIFVIFVAVNA
jgi:hypothetical protein